VEDAGRSSSKARGPHSRHDLAVNSPTWLDVHAGALTREVRDSQMEAAQQPGLHFHDLRVRQLGDAERGHPATPAMTMRYAQLSPDYLRTAVGRLDNVLAVSARQDAHKTGLRCEPSRTRTLDPLIKSCPEPRTQDTQADLGSPDQSNPH